MNSASNLQRNRATTFGLVIYAVLLLAVFAWAAAIRFRGSQVPMADDDTWGYLNPAISKLLGVGFVHSHGRNFVYPGLLYVLLRIFDDFRAIGAAQHVFGLLTGMFMILSWERAYLLINKPICPRSIHRGAGLLVAACYLLSIKPMLYEAKIRPESVFSFFAVLSVYLNVEFILSHFIKHNTRQSFVIGTLSVFTAVLIQTLRPTWGFGAAFAALPVLISLLQKGEPIGRRALRGTVPLVLCYVLLIAPEKYFKRSDEDSLTFLPQLLFVMHADMIRDQMTEDLSTKSNVPFPRDWLAKVQVMLAAEIDKTSTFGRETLGFNPDHLMFQNSICRSLAKEFGGDPHKLAFFCMYYYKRAALNHPRRMAAKVLNQLKVFYAIPCPVYEKQKALPLAESYDKSLSTFPSIYPAAISTWPVAVRYFSATEKLKTNFEQIPANRFVHIAHKRLGPTYLICLILTIILGIPILAVPSLRRHLGLLLAATALVYGYNFGNCLTVAIVHTLEVTRYIRAQLGFTMLAQSLTVLLVGEMALFAFKQWIDRRRLREVQTSNDSLRDALQSQAERSSSSR